MSCDGCGKPFRKRSNSGYCGVCFHANVNGVKTRYGASRWRSGTAKRIHWRNRGADLTEQDIARHEETNVCDLCGKAFDRDKCLDHDHKTGRYRGSLCRKCNAALGNLGDDLEDIIARLSRYRELADKVKW